MAMFFLMDCCDVHTYFGLKDLGVEEAQNWPITLVKRGTSQTDQEGLENPLMHTLKSTRRKVMASRNCVAVKIILPCVGCVGIVNCQAK